MNIRRIRTINEAHTSQGLNGGTDGKGYINPHQKSLLVIDRTPSNGSYESQLNCQLIKQVQQK